MIAAAVAAVAAVSSRTTPMHPTEKVSVWSSRVIYGG